MALDIPLLLSIGLYVVSSLGGVALVKFLNYHYCFASWWILALLSRSTWTLSLLLHVILQYRENVVLRFSSRQVGWYLVVACGLAIVEGLNSFSMSYLPGSLYMLLKGSDVGWSMSLSYILLHKRYNAYQTLAASLIMLGVALVFVVHPTTIREDVESTYSVASAALFCLLGAFLNALCSVAAEGMLKKTLQDEQERLLQLAQSATPSKLMLSNAYSLWTSFFSFGLLVIPVWVQEERTKNGVPSEPTHPLDCIQNATSYWDASKIQHLSIGIATCLGLLGASRFVERLCKHFICVYDSAVTFSMAQAGRRWLGIYILSALFQEEFSPGMFLGSLVSGIGFVLHTRARTSEEHHAYEKVASGFSDHENEGGGLELPETLLSNGRG